MKNSDHTIKLIIDILESETFCSESAATRLTYLALQNSSVIDIYQMYTAIQILLTNRDITKFEFIKISGFSHAMINRLLGGYENICEIINIHEPKKKSLGDNVYEFHNPKNKTDF